MSGFEPASRPVRVACLVVAGLVFAVLGLAVGGVAGLAPAHPTPFPAPHLVPQLSGGTALRIAMVHDVIHERYPRHGQAYYRERERRVRAELAAAGLELEGALPGAAPSLEALALLDDLGAALDRLHRPADAVPVLRHKLALLDRFYPDPAAADLRPFWETLDSTGEPPSLAPRQPHLYAQVLEAYATPVAPERQARYAAHANLGTFLIHSSFARAREGDAAARAALAEGHEHIRRAIALKPGAHFGRETWQYAAVEFFLAALERPELLVEYDLIGNPLAEAIEGRPGIAGESPFALRVARSIPPAWAPTDRSRVAMARADAITRLGGAYDAAVGGPHTGPVPFDEPTLGILGMWMLGGGPNPHFGIALGEVMLRINQRFIAWDAYERAVEMADRLSPDAGTREALVAHCRARQQELERALGEDPERLRKVHQAELARGLAYQEAYAAYEAERIAAGADIDDPGFYADFEAVHGSIASPPGEADTIYLELGAAPPWPTAFLGFGLGALLGANVRRRRR